MFDKAFWKAAGERAVRTFAQALVAVLTVTVAAGGGVEAVNWLAVGSAALLATLLSFLTSLVAGASNGNPAIGNTEVAVEKEDSVV